jgi:hypothetical protein
MAALLMAAARAGSDLVDTSRTAQPLRAVVVDGGFAQPRPSSRCGAYAAELVEMELVASEPRLSFRPATTAAPFTDAAIQSFELSALAATPAPAARPP